MRENTVDHILRQFEERTIVTDGGCLEWQGSRISKGYGTISYKKKNRRTHRVAYELYYGIDPGNSFVLHSCDNPPCINPLHLRIGNDVDNMQDMVSRGRHWNQKKTHCSNGHPYDTENTYLPSHRKMRACRQCNNDASRRYREAKKARLEETPL